MKRGDQVRATRNLGHMRPVPKGSIGVVRSVSFLGTYTVDFGGQVLTEVKRSDIAPADTGCGLLTLMACSAVTVALAAARRLKGRSEE